jgi:hypothetical protein
VQEVRALQEVDNADVRTHIIEPKKTVSLKPARMVHPSDAAVPDSFRTGPVFVTKVARGYVERETGLTFSSARAPIVESAMKARYIEQLAERLDDLDFAAAANLPLDTPGFVLSNQRKENYCRWWLDVVSKYYLFDRVFEVHGLEHKARRYVLPTWTRPFQSATLDALALHDTQPASAQPIIHGDLFMTPGLTFHGGQRISAEVLGFRSFALKHAQQAPDFPRLSFSPPSRLYISREKTRMRRVLNEDELFSLLADHGFQKVLLEDYSVSEQIELFRSTRYIVSPHGAGLTNILFCSPGTSLLEIFPRGGLHSSAFMRLATLLDIDYSFFCGRSVENKASLKNPNNADISCDMQQFAPFLKAFLSFP